MAWDKIILRACIDEPAAFDYFFQLLEQLLKRNEHEAVDPMLRTTSSEHKLDYDLTT